MMKEQTIRDELASIIKDLRARGRREPHPDAMDDNDIIFNTAYACALAETLHKKDLDLKLYAKFLEGWH
ncbi:MAG: hypothetical protein CMM02_03090 [Rhodopirellula sp.]|jgi:hypothetical protein|nr:hypothetical protein [Rhodopirellula sp.]